MPDFPASNALVFTPAANALSNVVAPTSTANIAFLIPGFFLLSSLSVLIAVASAAFLYAVETLPPSFPYPALDSCPPASLKLTAPP